MQLLIILALLLYGGKSGAQNIIKEVKPVLETIGGDEMKEALKSAEEISTVLSAVREFTGAANSTNTEDAAPAFSQEQAAESPAKNPAIAFPLAPVNNIADKDIAYSLSKYINEN